MFDSPIAREWAQIPFSVVDQPANRALAQRASRASRWCCSRIRAASLPLKKTLKTIAVIGPNADQWRRCCSATTTAFRPIRSRRCAEFARQLPRRDGPLRARLRSRRRLPGARPRSAERAARRPTVSAGLNGRVLLDAARSRARRSLTRVDSDDRRRTGTRARRASRHERRRLRRALDRHVPSAADRHLPARADRHDEVRALSRRQPRHALVLSDARRRVSRIRASSRRSRCSSRAATTTRFA